MTLRDVWNAVRGYHQKQDSLIKAVWEAGRANAAIMMQPYVPKSKMLRPRDLYVLPWDENRHKLDKKEVDKIKKRGAEIAAKWRKSIPKNV